jgi:hypothetical protein
MSDGYGGMQDRFDSITPPLTSFLVSPVIEEIKIRRESDFSLTLLLIHFCSSFHEMNNPKNNLSMRSSISLWMFAK